MNSTRRNISVMAAIFVIAAITAFIRMQMPSSGLSYVSEKTADILEQETVEYNNSDIPLIYIDTLGRQMNILHGYVGEAGALTYDTLSVLPDDRRLTVHTRYSSMSIIRASYEIRSADMSQLIEKTDITELQTTEDGVDMVLPIQNLLKDYTEYRLDITITTSEKGDIHYYSAIEKGDTTSAAQIVELADTFSQNNYDYDKARDNATYIETDGTAAEQTLGDVSLKSTYDQLTYNTTALSQVGERDIRLCAFNGNMGVVEITAYATSVTSSGMKETYKISEAMIYRQGAERWYMMDYKRTMSRLPIGSYPNVNGDALDMGIQPKDTVKVSKDKTEKYLAIEYAQSLGLYSVNDNTYKTIYSLQDEASIGRDYDKYNNKTLRVEDDGNIYFLSYGYMNTGAYEGTVGVSLLKYDAAEDSVSELLYIPAPYSAEELMEDVDSLAYLGDNEVFYIKLGSYIYGIDTESLERQIICDDLIDGTYAISADSANQKLLAWQDAKEMDGSDTLHLMELDTGDKKEIHAEDGQLLRTLGFMNTDLVVGIADINNQRDIHGKKQDIPCTAIEILDSTLTSQMHYQKEDRYISDIAVGSDATTLKLIIKESDGSFTYGADDMIINRVAEEVDDSTTGELIQKMTEDECQLNHTMVMMPKTVASQPDMLSTSLSTVVGGVIDDLKFYDDGYYRYIVYGHGRIVGSFDDIAKAVNRAYTDMGLVMYRGEIVYCRAATYSAKIIRNPETYAPGMVEAESAQGLWNIRGVRLRAALYYIGRNCPILTYSADGRRILIYGYDAHNISVYDIDAASYYKMNIEEAESMFDNNYDDFSINFTFGS